MASPLECLAQATERIERDLSRLDTEVSRVRELPRASSPQEYQEHLNEVGQLLVDAASVMTALALIRRRLLVLFASSGSFELSSSKRVMVDSLQETEGSVRATMYALIERSRSLRVFVESKGAGEFPLLASKGPSPYALGDPH